MCSTDDMVAALNYFAGLADSGLLQVEEFFIQELENEEEGGGSENVRELFMSALVSFLKAIVGGVCIRHLVLACSTPLPDCVVKDITKELTNCRSMLKLELHLRGERDDWAPLHFIGNALARIGGFCPAGAQPGIWTRQVAHGCSPEVREQLRNLAEQHLDFIRALSRMADDVRTPEDNELVMQHLHRTGNCLAALREDTRGGMEDGEENELDEFDREVSAILWSCAWTAATEKLAWCFL